MKGFSPPFLDALESYPWPGNVRELIGCLESALAAAGDEPTLFPDHLPIHIRIHLARASVAPPTPDPPPVQELPAVSHAAMPTLCAFRESATQTAENNYLQALMAQPGISIAEACRAAGLSRPRLYALLKKHGIVRTP
jgi:two-component system NtrC family response regulator